MRSVPPMGVVTGAGWRRGNKLKMAFWEYALLAFVLSSELEKWRRRVHV